MFIGKYYHTLETNGRASIPKALRTTQEWVITRGLDGGLFLFTKADFAGEVAQFANRSFTKKDNRDFIRLLTNEARELTTDKNGRVQLPEYLLKLAKIKQNIVFVGSWTRIELWDQDTYHKYVDGIEDKAEAIAQTIE